MAGTGVLTVADTIARSFLLAVEKRGDKPAIREKKFRKLYVPASRTGAGRSVGGSRTK